MTNKNKPIKYFQGHPNKEGTWRIRIIETGEVVEKYRTKSAAMCDLPRVQKIVIQKCEVVRG